jgi:hypothetical protein
MIGTRILALATPSGDTQVPITVEPPMGQDRNWSCRFEIGWPTGARVKDAHGVDAVQALLLALQMIGTDLYSSNEHAEGRLRWETKGAGYGFPVPKNLKNMLVGDDKVFFG